jgi:hypothetical protein
VSKPAAILTQSTTNSNHNDSDQGFVYYVDEDSNMTTDEPVTAAPSASCKSGKSEKSNGAVSTQPDPRTMTVKELKASIEAKGLTAKARGFIEKQEYVALLLEEYSKSTSPAYTSVLTHLLTYSLTYLLTHSLTHSLTQLTHSTHSLTHLGTYIKAIPTTVNSRTKSIC